MTRSDLLPAIKGGRSRTGSERGGRLVHLVPAYYGEPHPFDVMIVRPVRRGWNADAGLSWDVRLIVERYGERWQWQGARWEANQ